VRNLSADAELIAVMIDHVGTPVEYCDVATDGATLVARFISALL
jgi:hypothetical protein